MSSPLRPGATLAEELDYYKAEYAKLDTDLAEFQESSKALEEQLERDIEAAEKNERKLKQQIEKLKYESEEWKTKHQQAKAESNAAQNALQKEITGMREANRVLTLRLRDIEVVNDDYERQARNTESSLDDLESKYNVAIERSVLLEGEMKAGEQEREALRIETQRLRDDFGDLKVENDISAEKLRLADQAIERLRVRKPSPLAVESLRARSPGSEASGVTPLSPTMSTPPPRSDTLSEAATPPSPPLSDAAPPAAAKRDPKTPIAGTKRTSLIPSDTSTSLRPGFATSRTTTTSKHSRGPSLASTTSDSRAMRPPARPRPRPSLASAAAGASPKSNPHADSLNQIRNLRGRMQKIEERVHSARSKLPGPGKTRTPRGSPAAMIATATPPTATTSAAADSTNLPPSVTMRRSIKRPSSSFSFNSSRADSASEVNAAPRRESGIKRLSFGVSMGPGGGIPRPRSSLAATVGPGAERPGSSLAFDRPTSSAAIARPPSRTSRPSSRASFASNNAFGETDEPARPRSSRGATNRLSSSLSFTGLLQPGNRSSLASSTSAASTGLPTLTSPSNKTQTPTPKAKPAPPTPSHARSNSTLSGYATLHGTPRSMNKNGSLHRPNGSISSLRPDRQDGSPSASTPRRGTLDRGLFGASVGRRQSGVGIMAPPPAPRMGVRKVESDVGETY